MNDRNLFPYVPEVVTSEWPIFLAHFVFNWISIFSIFLAAYGNIRKSYYKSFGSWKSWVFDTVCTIKFNSFLKRTTRYSRDKFYFFKVKLKHTFGLYSPWVELHSIGRPSKSGIIQNIKYFSLFPIVMVFNAMKSYSRFPPNIFKILLLVSQLSVVLVSPHNRLVIKKSINNRKKKY